MHLGLIRYGQARYVRYWWDEDSPKMMLVIHGRTCLTRAMSLIAVRMVNYGAWSLAQSPWLI